MLTRTIKGDRIGKNAKISSGCSATIYSSNKQKILLTKRADNFLWCLPGGILESGESAIEACIREVKEETGFEIRIVKLIGIYSSPNIIVEYPDGNKVQIFALNFEAEIKSGNFIPNDEVTEINYFSIDEINTVPIFEIHKERISDALKGLSETIIK